MAQQFISPRPPLPIFPFCATHLQLPTAPPFPTPDRSAMSWISWPSLVPTLLILSASLAWWFTEPKTARINLIAAVGVALFCWAVAPELSRDLSYSLYASTVDALAALRLDLLILRHANMLLTGAAVVWYVGVVGGAVCRSSQPWLAPGRRCDGSHDWAVGLLCVFAG